RDEPEPLLPGGHGLEQGRALHRAPGHGAAARDRRGDRVPRLGRRLERARRRLGRRRRAHRGLGQGREAAAQRAEGERSSSRGQGREAAAQRAEGERSWSGGIVDDRRRDREQIGELMLRYAWMVDERRWEMMDEVFAEGATIDYTSTGG